MALVQRARRPAPRGMVLSPSAGCRLCDPGVGTKTRVKSILSGSWQGLPSETGEHRCTDLALSCGEWKSIFNQHYSIEELWHVCLLWAVAAGGRLAACHPSTGSKRKKKFNPQLKKKMRQINSSSHFLSTYMLGGGCFTWIITSLLLLSPLWKFYNYPWGKQGSEGEIMSPSSQGCGGIPIWNPRSVLLRSASVPREPARMSWAPQKSLYWHKGTIDCQLPRGQSLSWLVPSDPSSLLRAYPIIIIHTGWMNEWMDEQMDE